MLDRIAKILGMLVNPTTALALAMGSAVLLFGPSGLLAALGVEQLVAEHRGLVGLLLIFSCFYLAASLASWCWGRVCAAKASRRILRTRHRYLHDLTPQEKGYLAQYIEEELATRRFPFNDGVVGGLVKKDILFPATRFIDFADGTPYNIWPWARDYLKKHPELLQGDRVRAPDTGSWRESRGRR